ncbi:hypothetical protein KXV81_006758 [Aspergillus fumigatus]|uniref:Uncharacterized protein n=1 Tax=Aspergillus fumigatus TaxID=746128 RepID=A0A229Y4Y8_ASPFM|nr:hypothetical protein CNMCM8714_004184 [Aspergillus fumigatus]KAF4272367.1 hypothetical protein CNMCM8812_008788 [Aspergillus fumigatus]KAH1298308.1 hypothetical protein KXX30_007181 [Aspergillus fumigatus]KAH1322765.1 hypothetical protein KXX66_009138 [Aspergillus fumigatus]KAH1323028.1 hypothetical protein KXX38_007813 [Aspergillus fumigatus]
MSTETSDATQAQQTWKAPPAGSPCWVEIPARDTQKLKVGSRFCGDSVDFRRLCRRLLGPADDVLCLVKRAERVSRLGLTGGIVQMPEGCAPTEQIMGSGMTVYYLVDSLDMVEKTIHECGGGTCLPKTPESSHGWFMNFRDPEGNRFGCYEIRHS